jgi:hypothetical protein
MTDHSAELASLRADVEAPRGDVGKLREVLFKLCESMVDALDKDAVHSERLEG